MGKLRSAINYQQGKPSGEYELYYENGITEEHGFWANNKNINDFKRFYENGNPQQHFLFAGQRPKEMGCRNTTTKMAEWFGK